MIMFKFRSGRDARIRSHRADERETEKGNMAKTMRSFNGGAEQHPVPTSRIARFEMRFAVLLPWPSSTWSWRTPGHSTSPQGSRLWTQAGCVWFVLPSTGISSLFSLFMVTNHIEWNLSAASSRTLSGVRRAVRKGKQCEKGNNGIAFGREGAGDGRRRKRPWQAAPEQPSRRCLKFLMMVQRSWRQLCLCRYAVAMHFFNDI